MFKNGPQVTLQFPAIRFHVGEYANHVYETNNPVASIVDMESGLFLPPPQNGGYLYTKGGFLRRSIRPTSPLHLTSLVASGNAQTLKFEYEISSIPPPEVSGIRYSAEELTNYQLQITNSGAIVVQNDDRFANSIQAWFALYSALHLYLLGSADRQAAKTPKLSPEPRTLSTSPSTAFRATPYRWTEATATVFAIRTLATFTMVCMAWRGPTIATSPVPPRIPIP